MVKPMPANTPAPDNCNQFTSSGSLANFNLTAIKHNNKIPNGFPIKRPEIIPRLLFAINVSDKFPLKIIPVLAKAKIGTIIKATGL